MPRLSSPPLPPPGGLTAFKVARDELESPAPRALAVQLFGQMRVESDGAAVEVASGARSRELLCFLLLRRRRAHSREVVSSLLWGDHCTTTRSKTYLRKALWQLQSELHAELGEECELVAADAKWIRLGPFPALRLDVAVLEEAHDQFRDLPGSNLADDQARALRAAVDVYTGDLLEGWYQEWCLIERTRLQRVYLSLVDKLMAYYEAAGAHEASLAYGEQSLRYDRARECTYRRLIRCHTALGDRTSALRAFERCEVALWDDLAARPAPETVALAEAVRAGGQAATQERPADPPPTPDETDLGARLDELVRLQRELVEVQARVCSEVDALRRAIDPYRIRREEERPGTSEPVA